MKNLLGSKLKENVLESEINYVTNRLADGIQSVCDEITVMIVAGNIVTYMELLEIEDKELLNEFYNKYSKMEPNQFIKEAKELLDFMKKKYGIKDSKNNIIKNIKPISIEGTNNNTNTLKEKKKKISDILNNELLKEVLSDRNKLSIMIDMLKNKGIDLGTEVDNINLDEINILLDTFKLQLNTSVYDSIVDNISDENIIEINNVLDSLKEEWKNNDIKLKPLFNFEKLNQGAREMMERDSKINRSKKQYTCKICKDPNCSRKSGERKTNCIHHKFAKVNG